MPDLDDVDAAQESMDAARRALDALPDLTALERSFARAYADRLMDVLRKDDVLWRAIDDRAVRVDVIPAALALVLSFSRGVAGRVAAGHAAGDDGPH